MAPSKNTRGSANTQEPLTGTEPARGRGRGRGRGSRMINRPRNDNPPREPQRNNHLGRGNMHCSGNPRTSGSPAPPPAQSSSAHSTSPNKKRPPPNPEEGQPESQRQRMTVSRSNPSYSPSEAVSLGNNKHSPRLADTISNGTERREASQAQRKGQRRPVTRSQSNQLPSPFEVVSLGRNTNPRRENLQAGLNASHSTEWRTLRSTRTPAPTPNEPSSNSLDSRAPSTTGLIRSGSTPKRDSAFIKQPRAPRAAQAKKTSQTTSQPHTQTEQGAKPESDIQSEAQARAPQGAPSETSMAHGSEVPVENAEVWNSYHERYEQLKLVRDQQRAKAIDEGSMTDPTQRTSLKQAITPVGTCTAMCPEFERIERIVQKMVDKSEKYLHPRTGELQNLETKMIKRFRRSAAGYDEQLPSDIRTPETLLQTLNYILRNVIGGDEPLGVVHKFAWDRTRSIRNDLSIQQLTEEKDVRIAVKCLERIARFHILSLHLLVSPANTEPFSAHQDREQLNNTLLSLLHFYDDNRGRIEFGNEDEFRSYYIVFSIQDQRPDLEARIQRWPSELRRGPQVQVALELFAAAGNTWEYQGTLDAKRPNAIAQGFYSRFFQILDSDSVSYLLACVAEIYFNNVRQTAIRSIWRAYRRHPRSQQHKNEEWTLDEIRDALYFDTDEETRDFCEQQLLVLSQNSEGKEYLNWGEGNPDSTDVPPSPVQAFSGEYVEPKRCGRSLVAVILGKTVAQAAQSGMVVPAVLAESLPSQLRAYAETSEAPGESLFVSDDEGREDIMDESEPETQKGGQEPKKVLHWLEDNESGLLPLSPTGRPDEDLRNTPDATNMLTVLDDQTADHEPQSVDPSKPADSPSQGGGTSAGSRDKRIGPFLVSPSPSPPPSADPAPNKEQSEARPDVQDVASARTQQSESDTAAQTGPMNVGPEVREPAGVSLPALTATNAPTLQTAALGSATQVPGPAAVDPNASMFGVGPQWTETQSVGNSQESGGLSELLPIPCEIQPGFNQSTTDAPMPGAPGQFSTPAGLSGRKTEENVSRTTHAVQPFVEPQGSAVAQDAFLPRPVIGLSDQPATNGASAVVEEIGPVRGPTSAYTTSTMEASPAVPAEVDNPPLPSTNLEQPPISKPFGEVEEVRPVVDSTPVGPTSGQTDSTPSGEQLEARPSEPLPSAPEPATTREGPMVQSTQEAAPVEVVTPPEATTDKIPAVEKGSWLSSEQVNNFGWRVFLCQIARERREAYREEVARSRKRSLEGEEDDASMGSRKATRVTRESVAPTVPDPEASVRVSPVASDAAVITPPPSAVPIVDQDELLLSAARVTADALAKGSHLWENVPPPRQSLRPVPAPIAESASRNASPSGRSRIHVNGYEVALAPESPLGLGRSLSRTEQRIRKTGARGLASRAFHGTRMSNRGW